MRKCNTTAAILGMFLFLGEYGNIASGAAVPFAENFSGSAPDFTYSSSNANVTAVVGSDVLTIDSTLATGGQSLNALVDISNANGISLAMKTDITPTVWLANGGSAAGFLAFSTNPAAGAFPSGANSGYLADIAFPTAASPGSIRILDNANALATIVQSPQFPVGSLALNETYNLTFTAKPGLGGTLDLSLTIVDTMGTLIDDDGIFTISATTPSAASTGTFFGYRHRVGNNGTGASRTFDAVYDNFTIGPPSLSGDFNVDGKVDAADYVLWRKDPNAHGGDPAGYSTWRANFSLGSGTGSVLGGNANVPEPGVILLAVGAVLVWCGTREKRFVKR